MFKQRIPHSFASVVFSVTCLFSCSIYANTDYDSSNESRSGRGDPYKTRAWNWDYKETWREDKDAFFSGGNQTKAIQQDFRYEKPPGIGDPDDAYWLDPQFYRRPDYDSQHGYYAPYTTYYNQQRPSNQAQPYSYDQRYDNQRYNNQNGYYNQNQSYDPYRADRLNNNPNSRYYKSY